MKATGWQLALMVAMAIAMVPVLLALWLGPLAWGVFRIREDGGALAWALAVAGAGWAALQVHDKTLPGLLFGVVGSLLIQAGLMKDPWDELPEDRPDDPGDRAR